MRLCEAEGVKMGNAGQWVYSAMIEEKRCMVMLKLVLCFEVGCLFLTWNAFWCFWSTQFIFWENACLSAVYKLSTPMEKPETMNTIKLFLLDFQCSISSATHQTLSEYINTSTMSDMRRGGHFLHRALIAWSVGMERESEISVAVTIPSYTKRQLELGNNLSHADVGFEYLVQSTISWWGTHDI